MNVTKRILSLFAAFAIVFSLAAPVFAAEDDNSGEDDNGNTEYVSRSNLWSWVASNTGSFGQAFSRVTGAGCPESSDGRHHSSKSVWDVSMGHYVCTCDYCGATYVGTETEMKDSYNDFVDSMPCTGIDSDGCMIWQSHCYDFWGSSLGEKNVDKGTQMPWGIDNRKIEELSPYNNPREPWKCDLFFTGDTEWRQNHNGPLEISWCNSGFGSREISYYLDVPYENARYMRLGGGYQLVCCIDNPDEDYRVFDYCKTASGWLIPGPISFTTDIGQENHPCSLSFTIPEIWHKPLTGGQFEACTATLYCPAYKVQLLSGNDLSSNYSIDYRPTSINGNYGIIGDNGQLTKIDMQTIVNEGDHTVYNPVTGDTLNFSGWDYDYSTRTYELTLDTGEKTTVTYGDENITITEGGQTYNVYYLVDNPGGGSGGGGSSGGGSGSGNGSGDSGSSDSGILKKIGELLGSIFKGIIDAITAFFGKILDGLIKLADLISGKFAELVEKVLSWFDELPALFEGFLAFLSACFGFLPAELVTILTFGVTVCVFIGIIKAIRR